MGANGFIGGMALQPDGKLLIVGGFSVYNGTPILAQARLYADGTLDASFAGLPSASLRQLGAVAVQPDGKILVGGVNNFNNNVLPTVQRLQADGTPDASFTPPTGPAGEFVRTILVQADGKILLGGSASTTASALSTGLQRLNTDGSVDSGFSSPIIPNTSVATYALAQQPDGKLLVGGSLAPGGTTNPGVIRLLASGALDNTFALGSGPASGAGAAAAVRTLALLPSGSILVGGTFAVYNGVARGRVLRLLPTGAVDTGFAFGAGANNAVNMVAATASGQVLAAGSLTQYDAGAARTGLVRLTATGAEDATFTPPTLETRGTINRAAQLATGQLLVQGNFVSVNGMTLAGSTAAVRRFQANGTLDATYTSTATSLLGPQPDGTFFSLGFNAANTQYALLRVLPTGAADNTFANPAYFSSGAATWFVAPQGVVMQPDGKLLVHGTFTNFGGAARNGLVRLAANGTVDNTFLPPAGSLQRLVMSATLQSSGKLVISYNELVAGTISVTTGTGTVLVRLNPDGSVDNTFNANGSGPNPGAYFGVLVQPDGKLLLTGSLSTFNGQAVSHGTVRLTADGAVDNTFNQLTADYTPVLVQPDGHLLANTTTYSSAPGTNNLVRLNSDGSLDGAFAPIRMPRNIFAGDNAVNGYLYQAADDKIIAYGSFTSVLGQVRVGLARLVPGVVTASRAATAAHSLVVYPNPAHQQLVVVLPPMGEPAQATLLSLTGQVVRQWPVSARQPEAVFDLSAVAPGLYVLRLPSAAGVYQQKVVVAP